MATVGLAIAGARRIDVVWAGKAGTLALMFALPMFLIADAARSVRFVFDFCGWGFAIGGIVLGYFAAVKYVPAARAALRGRPDARGSGGGGFMKAVILAGGEGTRLRPLTSNQPKPMMPIANAPMMEHIVRLLAKHGFDDIVVTVAFLANHIRNYFGDGSEFGVRMQYATEESPLGTAGSVRNAMDELDETFLVVAGDALTDIDLGEVMKAHRAADAFATIALKRVENPVEFGIVITREDGTIERFLEKPTWGEVFSDTINTNIYVLEPEIFDFIAPDEVVDFSGDVFPEVLARGKKLVGHVIDGYWEDVGTLEAYRRAHEDILDGRMHIEMPGFEVRDGVWLGEGADLSPEAEVYGPVLDRRQLAGRGGRGAAPVHRARRRRRREGRRRARALRRPRPRLHRSERAAARRGRRPGERHPRRRAPRGERRRSATSASSATHAIINPSVKIYPFKMVEAGALVTSSIVWESKGARTLFGRRGVRGLANVDITSEVAVRLAMAYGTALKKGSVVCTSRDTSRSARALKRALIAGLNLSGVHVMDLELSTVPLTRFQVRTQHAQGGISVRLASGDPDSVEIRFMDEYGADIDEGAQRKIERLLYREDFRRAFAGDIGDIVFPPRAIEFYTAALEASVQPERLRRRSFKVVLDYSYGATSILMPNVLAKLGASVLAVNPFAATSGATGSVDDLETRVKTIGDLVRTSGSDLGYVFDPDGETATIIDDQGVPLVGRAGAARAGQARVRATPGIAARAAGLGEPRGRAPRSAQRRADHVDEAVGVAPHGGGRRAATSTSRRRRKAGSSGRRSCPRTTRSPRSCTCSTCSRRAGGRCRRSSPRCPRPTSRTTSCRRRGNARAR